MEGPIDPAQYIVGPSDVFAITIGGVSSFTHAGPVTPEGTLVIPTVGEVVVAGNTLAEVKQNIRNAVRKKYTTGDIGVHLLSLRAFKVSVVGAVSNPGAYIVTPVDRVDRVVSLANFEANAKMLKTNVAPETPPTFFTSAEKPPVPISLRNIKLFRAKRDTLAIDLVRYYAAGETHCNPYLRDGDVIIVPAENLAGNSVSISGGVRQPGVIEFHDGDSLRMLLRIAQGPTALADLDQVEVARFLPDGRQVQILTVNLNTGQNGHAPDMALQRNDRIFIRENPEMRKERTVSVFGAVARPGEYALIQDHTMLSEIIQRAGGFNPDASIAESKLIRNYKNPDELRKNPDYARLLEVRLMDLKPPDRDYFNYEMALKRGFVAVDFARLFNQRDTTSDVEVWQGDEIYVPTLRQTINVFGQVSNPGYVTYINDMEYRYYIEKAGGFSKAADRNKVRILKRDTNAWLKPDDTKLEPGDQIFVSRRIERPSGAYFNTIRDILQIAASFATVALLVIQVSP
jgi:protein involved in polysaccharide export with SLBB domain